MIGVIKMIYSVINLNKKIKNKSILNNINFNIDKGSIISVLGKNGAGKTTLIKIMSGLLQKTSGQIYYNELELYKIKSSYYNEVSVILEGDRNTYWYLTGIENILYFGRLHKIPDKIINERAYKLLKQFDLFESKNVKVCNYSRGMKQKLSIIISLINNPSVLFLDEPTLGLDVWSKNSLVEIIKDLVKNNNLTVILTSHQLDVVEQLSKEVILLDDGKVIYQGSIEKFKNEDKCIYEVHYKGNLILNNEYFEILKNKEDNGNCIRLETNNSFNDLFQFFKKQDCEIISISKENRTLEDFMLKQWEK
jgi:ABC-2 type transport system ATP-binding protein